MTYTYLRVGTKPFRSKPPRKGAPCSEPIVYGTNILKDPGFELHDANVPNGPAGYDFPGDGFGPGSTPIGSLYWDATNITDTLYYDTNGWAVFSNNSGGDGLPVLSTANPRSGTYHWRVSYPPATISGAETYPIPVGGKYCTKISGRWQAYSARVEPGDFVRFGVYAMANTTTGTPTIQMSIGFYDSAAASITTVTGTATSLTTGYVWYESTAVAPASSYAIAVEANLWANTSQSATLTFDVDDAVLEVS